MYREGEYAFIEGNIFSSDKGEISCKDYLKVTNEYLVPHSTAKRARFSRSSYMVGALARVNNNYNFLSSNAKEAAENLGLKPMCYNPYMNTVAQLVELIHIVDNSTAIIDDMLENGIKDENPVVPELKKCTGVGAVEVPRGILFHEYTYDENGFITKANCIIPTGQNLQNIEDDMNEIVPAAIKTRTREELTLDLEMLVRAYDPCISCSCHLLDVEFVNE